MKPKIYVTRKLPQTVMDTIAQEFDYDVYPEDQVIPHDVMVNEVQGKEGILCILTDTINKEVFEAASQAKIFANYAVGYNNIDIEEATKRGIAVTNTPGVLTDATADLAWALLFSVARNIVDSDNQLRAGKFDGWGPNDYLGQDVTNKTLGVIGLGRIGRAFAQRASAFNMKVLYTSRSAYPDFEESYQPEARKVELDELLQQSDYVSIHVPLTPETTHLIGEKELKLMQPHAILINTARGPVVDEEALVKALKEKWIWGAGLDVYEKEPVVHPELIPLKNAILLPHIGSATTETRTKMGLIAVDNLKKFFSGQKPPNIVNPEVWKKS